MVEGGTADLEEAASSSLDPRVMTKQGMIKRQRWWSRAVEAKDDDGDAVNVITDDVVVVAVVADDAVAADVVGGGGRCKS